MTQRMLINATHAEETRVAVIDGNRLVEFDHETSTKKQLKGNVYLAKVVRVEPSLQAAFVEYGGNRHGFLAFNEIHPDYYRIPISDREALLAQQASGEEEREDEGAKTGESVDSVGGDETEDFARAGATERQRINALSRRYKIQEVIKRRQILLVQVVKEERGNKGAALTTYLSLAGRYCVLMPNTASGGGISRKISSSEDRRRLKAILGELAVLPGMAVILRTAGMERSKAEIKRDYEYLRRLWDEIRERTLNSTAPCLIHEEANIIKRALRDIYAKEIEEVLVEGEEAYKTAKAFMKTMLPSHTKRVQYYAEAASPLFHRFHIESQLDEIQKPTVKLRSGGYIVLNQTEALVAIDVNSGRATRERNIEETALATNREAAEEVARQLRLRDLAGLIVIDFIDMEHARNNATVERVLKDAMKSDRARLQVGRISPFGLLELSRQRLRPSMVEANNLPCPTCGGVGHIRSTESSALRLLRALEEEGMRQRGGELVLNLPESVALYILNHKRAALSAIEQRYAFRVIFTPDATIIQPDFRVEHRASLVPVPPPTPEPVRVAPEPEPIEADETEETEDESAEAPQPEPGQQSQPTQDGEPRKTEHGEEGRDRRRQRRRRRRPGDDRGGQRDTTPLTAAPFPAPVALAASAESDVGIKTVAATDADGNSLPPAPASPRPGDEAGEGQQGRRRRRGRRGGRRRGRGGRGREGAPGFETAGTETSAPRTPGGPEDLVPGPFPVQPESSPDAMPDFAASASAATVPPTVAAMAALEREPMMSVEAPETHATPEFAPIAGEAFALENAPRVRRRPSRARVAMEAEAPAAVTVEPLTIAEPVTPPTEVAPPQAAPVVSAHTNGAAASAPEPAAGDAPPRKRGWWNRFIGEGQS
ncbi:MAG: ribonuclease E/G [Alphaproteobacteria bacterium]|nr:ribonuclease E/G [Alphaproteobacteria bacterium]